MAVPFVLVAGGLALALLAMGSDDEKKKPGNGTGGTGGTGGLPPGIGTDIANCLEDIPEPLRSQILAVIGTVASPEILEGVAEQLAKAGYVEAAECFQARADDLKGETPVVFTPPEMPPNFPPGVGLPWPGGMAAPFVVRYGDYPYGMAQYYTGQGARYVELEPLNPQLGPMITRTGPQGDYSIYQNWQAGLEILLPPSWQPWTKPYPLPGTQKPSGDYPAGYQAA